MRKFVLIVLYFGMLYADEVDMFDVVDSDAASLSNEETSNIHARVKLSYLMQNHSDNTRVAYGNISQSEAHYVYDIRAIANKDTYALHIKDMYLKTNFDEKYFFELGRMNVKEGVARGYNPTDYFKGSPSFTLSNDPKEKKDNRLGTVLIQATAIYDDYTLKALYSPRISIDEGSIWGQKKHFGLQLNESNAEDRATLYVGYTGLEDVSLSTLWHYDGDGSKLGLNVSYVDERSIWYVEASFGRNKSDMTNILQAQSGSKTFAKVYGSKKRYRAEVSMGINYTASNNIVTTFEYIYNDAGFDSRDWKDYFLLSQDNPQYAGTLGMARGLLASKEKMISKHSLFMMARESDVLPNLDWVSMAWVNPIDKSALLQVGVTYNYADVLFSVDMRSYAGKQKSEYGSMKNDYEALVSVEYYF